MQLLMQILEHVRIEIEIEQVYQEFIQWKLLTFVNINHDVSKYFLLY